MLSLAAHTGTFTTVFTAMYDGIYLFVAVGAGQFRTHNATEDKVITDLAVTTNQHSFPVFLAAGDELQHQNGPATLYGVRVGDEL